MAVTQYIGARYVPVFVGEWDSTKAYEALSIVQHNGNSYTSVQAVPSGIDIEDTSFWAETGNYNAQVEAYRKEVLGYTGQIEDVAVKADSALEQCRALEPKITANTNSIKAENTRAANAEKENADAISAEVVRAQDAEKTLDTKISSIVVASKRGIVLLGDSWCTYNDKNIGTTLAGMPGVAYCKNYGVAGAKIQGLAAQCKTALADKNLDIKTVTDVFVVAGTNNVYWDTDVSQQDAYSAFTEIGSTFPYAKVHWFPNNAKTNNSYRNARYVTIGRGVAQAGASIHLESLTIPFSYNNSYYNSNWAVAYQDNQHLTAEGSRFFAEQIMNLANGGTAPELNFRLTFDTTPNSKWSGTNLTNAYYHGSFHHGYIEFQFGKSLLSVNTSESATNNFYCVSTDSPLQGLAGGSNGYWCCFLDNASEYRRLYRYSYDKKYSVGFGCPVDNISSPSGISGTIPVHEGFLSTTGITLT